jgi:NAD+--asparagine ADP-ribosyltransferase
MSLDLTVEEIVETLKRSSLTTVLVEGKDDVIIYRWLEDEIGISNANFLPCGGRDKLLQIYERRNEFSDISVIFVADRDAYVYINPPNEYQDIIWTNGYSVENDLYYGREIESLLSNEEKNSFIKSLNSFIEYYAFEVENLIDGNEFNLRNHPQYVLCDIKHEIKEEFLETIDFKKANEKLENNIKENYDVLVRGKSLFALLTRILSNKARKIKHSKMSLLEHCYRTHESEKFKELIQKIEVKISA